MQVEAKASSWPRQLDSRADSPMRKESNAGDDLPVNGAGSHGASALRGEAAPPPPPQPASGFTAVNGDSHHRSTSFRPDASAQLPVISRPEKPADAPGAVAAAAAAAAPPPPRAPEGDEIRVASRGWRPSDREAQETMSTVASQPSARSEHQQHQQQQQQAPPPRNEADDGPPPPKRKRGLSSDRESGELAAEIPLPTKAPDSPRQQSTVHVSRAPSPRHDRDRLESPSERQGTDGSVVSYGRYVAPPFLRFPFSPAVPAITATHLLHIQGRNRAKVKTAICYLSWPLRAPLY